MTPANIIRRLRKKSGLSMAALAEAIGVSRQAIHLIETGNRWRFLKRPNDDSLKPANAP